LHHKQNSMIKILPATYKPDFECISNLARIIWHEHYPSIISLGQIDYMLDKFNSVNAIEAQTKEGILFFCITYNEEPIGYTAVKKEDGFLFLRKLYILSNYRGKGIAKTTMQFIEKTAYDFDLKSIRLYVNKYNTNSILAYEKMGFIKIKSMITDIGEGYVMDDFEMEKRI
jgi:diamine N-acetyltransferase